MHTARRYRRIRKPHQSATIFVDYELKFLQRFKNKKNEGGCNYTHAHTRTHSDICANECNECTKEILRDATNNTVQLCMAQRWEYGRRCERAGKTWVSIYALIFRAAKRFRFEFLFILLCGVVSGGNGGAQNSVTRADYLRDSYS